MKILVAKYISLGPSSLRKKHLVTRRKIFARLSTEIQLFETELDDKRKIILMDLAEMESAIIMNSFRFFCLAETKSLEFITVSKSWQAN